MYTKPLLCEHGVKDLIVILPEGNNSTSHSRLRPLTRVSLHSELVERLRDMVIEGTLAPGARINEVQLCQELGVSRTPLREAIKALSSEGLIELVSGRGALVKKFSARDVQEMLAVLTALEIMAARLACRSASQAQVRKLRSLHDEMMRHYKRKSRLEYYKYNQTIHSYIVQLSGNNFLAAQHESIQARIKRIRFIGNENSTKWRGAAAEHEEIVAAFEARDEEALCAVIQRHLDHTWERVQDTL
jgi:DNA-binding GntR family transcriptional regulator